MTPLRVAGALLALGLAAGCSSGTSTSGDDDPDPVGGDVRQVPGQVVVADSLAVSPDGSTVAAACGSDLCRWTAADGMLGDTWSGGPRVAWSPDGSLVATPGDQEDGRAPVLLLDADGGEVATLPGHEAEEAQDAVGTGLTALVFSPDGSLLASAGHDGTVRLWSMPEGEPAGVLDSDGAVPDSLAFSPDGDQLAVAAADAPVEVWDVDGRLAGTLDAEPQQAVAWSSTGVLATAGDTVRVWDGTDLRPRGQVPEPRAAHRLAFSPDGGSLAITQLDDPEVLVWPVGADRVRTLSGHDEAPRGVAWAPDGGTLYTVSGSDGVLAWDPGTGDVRRFELPEV